MSPVPFSLQKKFGVTKTLHPPVQWNVAAAVGLKVSKVFLDRFVPSYSRHNQHSPTWDAGPIFHSHKSRAWWLWWLWRGRNPRKPEDTKTNTFFVCQKVDVSNLMYATLPHLCLLLGRNFPEIEKTLQTSSSKNERKVDRTIDSTINFEIKSRVDKRIAVISKRKCKRNLYLDSWQHIFSVCYTANPKIPSPPTSLEKNCALIATRVKCQCRWGVPWCWCFHQHLVHKFPVENEGMPNMHSPALNVSLGEFGNLVKSSPMKGTNGLSWDWGRISLSWVMLITQGRLMDCMIWFDLQDCSQLDHLDLTMIFPSSLMCELEYEYRVACGMHLIFFFMSFSKNVPQTWILTCFS